MSNFGTDAAGYGPNFIPGEPEPDIESLPGHVFVADDILDRYHGVEPITNWSTWDLIALRDACETEIRSRHGEPE